MGLPQGIVTPVDIQLMYNQFERFAVSQRFKLHAKIKPFDDVHQIIADVADRQAIN
jgi:hypothetical protein